MPMLVLLPIFTFLCLCCLFHSMRVSQDLRLTLLLGAAAWGILLTIITEILSFLKLFNPSAMAAAWALASGGLLFWLFIRRNELARQNLPLPSLSGLSRLEGFQLLTGAGIAALTGFLAVAAAPNNWDSMVYHLSRVMHWLQNQTVAFYPTHILRQLYLPPWSEYFLAHVVALSGGDRLAQLPQWFAMLGSAVGISLLAKQLGAGRGGQIFAGFAAATLPMSLLQAATTQNDAVLTFWLVALVVFIFKAVEELKTNPYKIFGTWNLAIAASLSLALLTKSTAYIFALPFMLYFGIAGLKKYQLRFGKAVLVITLIVAAINLPHLYRNASLFGHPLGPQYEVSRYRNQPISLQGAFSNIVRNAGMYLGTVEPLNQTAYTAVEEMHNWVGLDVNDPRFTWSDHRFAVTTPRAHEDTTASGFHLFLYLAALLILILQRRRLPSQLFLLLAGLLFAGFVLFCVYLRWQTWHPRLHLPLFVIFSANLGGLPIVLHRRLIWGISILLAFFTLPIFYFNPNKPLIADYNIFNLPRREVMIMRKDLVVPYIEGVNVLVDQENCFQVGLFLPEQDWEYPIWRLFEDADQPYHLQHIFVPNASRAMPAQPFEPCALFSTQRLDDAVTLDGKPYEAVWELEPVYIYAKDD